jgi:hypothetical protein
MKRARLLAVLAGAALVALSCSGGSGDGQGATSSGPKPDDLVVEVASYDLAVGARARFMVGVLTADHRFVGFGTVQMRFAYLGAAKGARAAPAYGSPSSGSFLAIPGTEVPVPPPTRPTIVDASTGRGVYATNAAFDRVGIWQVEVTATIARRRQHATAAFTVASRHAVPAPGDAALPSENHTLGTSDVPPGAVDSRAADGDIPDPELHRTTIAAALAAHRPLVAVFSTPVYCVSRFCGPVTEMVQQLARDYGDRASFVHVEIWRDFEAKEINRAAADWLLRDGDLQEPWVFVVGADGRILARFDNVATRGELELLLRPLPVIGSVP